MLLSDVKKCWETTTPEEHWAAWLGRKERFEEESLVKYLLDDDNLNSIILDIGCGSGRYARAITYKSYVGIDPWLETVKYARELSKDYPKATFLNLGVYDKWPIQPEVVLTLNVFRHFQDPEKAYYHIWDNLPKGSIWITDFLTHSGEGVVLDGEFSSLVSKNFVNKFLLDKKHTQPINWLFEVGDWWLVRIEK